VIHKNRTGVAIVDYMCREGDRDTHVVITIEDSGIVCHCDDPNCAHKVQCDRSCEKPSVKGRHRQKSYTSIEEMGY